MVVDAVVPVPDRGVVVGGLVVAGRRPGPGALVAVSAPDGSRTTARVLGVAAFDRPVGLARERLGDRQVELLLGAVAAANVPPGSTIAEAAPT